MEEDIPLKQTSATEGLGHEQIQYTSNHAHRITNLQNRFEHKVRHQTMYPFEPCKCFRGIVRSKKLLEYS